MSYIKVRKYIEDFSEEVSSVVFGLQKEEVTEDWRKFHNEKLHDLQFSPNIIR